MLFSEIDFSKPVNPLDVVAKTPRARNQINAVLRDKREYPFRIDCQNGDKIFPTTSFGFSQDSFRLFAIKTEIPTLVTEHQTCEV